MKIRSNKSLKPWDNIPIDEIQPYAPKNDKIIIASYIFLIFLIFENIHVLKINFNYYLLISFCIYGILAFSLLYLYNNGNVKKSLNLLGDVALFITFIFIILNVIILLVIKGFSILNGLNLSFGIVEFAMLIYGILVAVNIFLGPIYLVSSHQPKLQKHGFIIMLIFMIAGLYILF